MYRRAAYGWNDRKRASFQKEMMRSPDTNSTQDSTNWSTIWLISHITCLFYEQYSSTPTLISLSFRARADHDFDVLIFRLTMVASGINRYAVYYNANITDHSWMILIARGMMHYDHDSRRTLVVLNYQKKVRHVNIIFKTRCINMFNHHQTQYYIVLYLGLRGN